MVAFYWIGDASSGAVPSTPSTGQGITCCQGYQIVSVSIKPGTPAPTSGYSVKITDSIGVDALGGAAASLSATTAASYAANASASPVNGAFNLVVTGNSVAAAQGTVYVFLSKPGTVNLALLNLLRVNTTSLPFADARLYGVTCNGTTDDAPSLQSAVNLALSTTIMLPRGTCVAGSTVARSPGVVTYVKGQGMSATIWAVASSFSLVANGVFDWSPGDVLAVPVGGVSELTIQFEQPDSTNIALYTHWPPGIYTAGTYHSEWTNIAIIRGWDCIKIPTNTNGALFRDIYASCFHRLFDLDNSFDSVIIDNAHSSTTGLTANQGVAFLATATAATGFYMGRVDDLKISNSTIGTPVCADFHSGSGGLGAAAALSNFWCEGTFGIGNGQVQIENMHAAIGGSSPMISMSGGQLFINDLTSLYVGSGTMIAAVVVRQASSAAGTYPPMLSIANSRIDTQGIDVAQVFATTAAPFVGKFNVILDGNLFFRNAGTAYANGAVQAIAGTGDTRLTATGNAFYPNTAGSGVGFQMDTDTGHNITGNEMGLYSITYPATVANIVSAANSGAPFNQNILNGSVAPGSCLFADLASCLPVDGRFIFCRDCTIASPCAGVGLGAIAKRLNSVMVCN